MNTVFFLIIDNIFRFLLLFFFNLIWVSYFFRTSALSIAISIAIAILTCIIINVISNKKIKKTLPNKIRQQHMDGVINTLTFMPNHDVINFFYRMTSKKHNCHIESDYIVISSDKDIILYPMFCGSTLGFGEFTKIIKKVSYRQIKRLVILTNDYDKMIETKNFFDFEVLILNASGTYEKLLSKYEFYPEIKYKSKPTVKSGIKTLTLGALNKKKTKGYLLSAIFVFFASFFVRFKIYYSLISSLLVMLAIFSYFNVNFNKDTKAELLD